MPTCRMPYAMVHKHLGTRQRDETFQKVVLDYGLESAWQEAAQHRQQWNRMALTLVQKVARMTHALAEIPRGRFMMQETPWRRSHNAKHRGPVVSSTIDSTSRTSSSWGERGSLMECMHGSVDALGDV